MSMQKFIEPKSDQLNADDLFAGNRVIKVTKVKVTTEAQQGCTIWYEGDNGKPWKPCKSMGRVLVFAWGIDPQNYVGKSIELYRDAEAIFGGQKVGGIRIAALSDIDADFDISLTVSRGTKRPVRIKKMKVASAKALADMDPADIPDAGKEAASKGTAYYNSWCNARTAADKVHIKPLHPEWKKLAADVDAAAANNTGEPDPSVTG